MVGRALDPSFSLPSPSSFKGRMPRANAHSADHFVSASPAKSASSTSRVSERSMAKSGATHPQVCGIQPARLGEFLRAQHPLKTAACAAAAIGASERTIANWIEGRAQPNAYWVFALVAAYGPGLLAQCMARPPAWLIAACDAEANAQIRAQITALEGRLRT